MAGHEEEKVLVVPRAIVPVFQGFLAFNRASVLDLVAHGRYIPRSHAEHDDSWKQIIPYSVIMAGGKVFKYRRGVKGGESRLFGLISIGVGGHMSSGDADRGGEVYDQAFARELSEEVEMAGLVSNDVRGLINDDSNPVGRVHLGVVHLLKVDQPLVRSREDELVDDGFMSADELISRPAELETWARICLENWHQIVK